MNSPDPLPDSAPIAADSPRFPIGIGAVFAVLLASGGAGLAAAFASDPARAGSAALANLLFWTGLGAGATLFIAVAEITGAKWPGDLKRVAAGFRLLTPLGAVLLLAFGRWLPGLWVVSGPEHAHGTPGFKLARDAAALASLAVLGWFVSRTASRGPEGAPRQRPVALAAVYALCFTAALSLVSADLVMALTPAWTNTLYPAYFFVTSFLLGLAAVTAVGAAPWERLRDVPRAGGDRLRDLSNLTLGFGLFSGYLFYTQVLVAWFGNLRNETSYLIARGPGTPWAWVSKASAILLFALPLAVIPVQKAKKSPAFMSCAGAGLLLGGLLDRTLAVAPSAGAVGPSWIDAAAAAAFLGLAGLAVLAGRLPAMPDGRAPR